MCFCPTAPVYLLSRMRRTHTRYPPRETAINKGGREGERAKGKSNSKTLKGIKIQATTAVAT
eukprot:scaffold248673_cov37-Tisochrysis_lutea.AAC.5